MISLLPESIQSGIERAGEAWLGVESLIHGARGHFLRKRRCLRVEHPDPVVGESLLVPEYRQLDSYGCGAIAGYTVIKSLYPSASFKEFYQSCTPDPRGGLSDWKLLKGLRAFGVGVSKRSGRLPFSEIKHSIGLGFPILATVDSGPNEAHWVVVYGWSDNGEKRVYMANPSFTNPLPYREFSSLSRRWNSYVCWGRE
jgi:hypothetical protein